MQGRYLEALGVDTVYDQIYMDADSGSLDYARWLQLEELRKATDLPLPPDLFPVFRIQAQKRPDDFCTIVGGADARTRLVATTLLRVAQHLDKTERGPYMKTAIRIAEDVLAGSVMMDNAASLAADGATNFYESRRVRHVMWAASAIASDPGRGSFAGIRDLYGLADEPDAEVSPALTQILNQALEEHLNAL